MVTYKTGNEQRAFLFNANAWPQPQTALFTCTSVPHFGQAFLSLPELTDSIATCRSQQMDEKRSDVYSRSTTPGKSNRRSISELPEHVAIKRMRVRTHYW